MTTARTQIIYTNLLDALWRTYAPQHAPHVERWRQQAARMRLTGRRAGRAILVQKAA